MADGPPAGWGLVTVAVLLLAPFTAMIHLLLPQLPDLVTQLGLLYHTIESRVKMFHKLSKLHGKLYLLTSQVGSSGELPEDQVCWYSCGSLDVHLGSSVWT